MSSARRYQEDIRRIVGVTEDGRRLDDALPRMRILGQRGIYQIGSGETKSGSAPGEDENGNPVDPVMPDENEDNQNSDGSGTGGTGTDAPGTDGGDFEIDPSNPPPNTNIDDATFGGGWGSGGLSSFTDCQSGKCIQIVDRGGYVPPPGWESADDPPIDPDYDAGFWWGAYAGINIVTLSQTPSGALRDFDLLYPDVIRCGLDLRFTGTDGRLTYWMMTISASGNCLTTSTFQLRKYPCPPGSAVLELFGGWNPCAEPPPRPDHWPADNCIQLAQNSAGQWAASPRENPSDMIAQYSAPRSILDLCAPNGNGVQILPGKDGGTVRWNYTQGIFMAVSPTGQRSFGGATEVTQAVAGAVAGGGAIKPVGAPRPGD